MIFFSGRSAPSNPWQPMSVTKYAFTLAMLWLYTLAWVWAAQWVITTDRSVLIRLAAALALIVGMPSLGDLFTSYTAYAREFSRSASAIRDIEVPEGSYDRATSLRLLAEALERVLETSWPEHADAILARLPADLHPDVGTLLGINVSHFLAAFDIRRRDEGYRQMQESDMRNLIRDLREGAPLDELMKHDFL